MAIKLKGLIVEEPTIKKQISLKKSDYDMLEKYLEYLKEETGMDHSVTEVASLMITNWMLKDAAFNKWRKSQEKKENSSGKKDVSSNKETSLESSNMTTPNDMSEINPW